VDKEAVRILRDILGALGRIESLLRLEAEANGLEPQLTCPACGSTDLIDSSAMGDMRMTCRKCGKSAAVEAISG
jgi:transcription elongation factor Elf1